MVSNAMGVLPTNFLFKFLYGLKGIFWRNFYNPSNNKLTTIHLQLNASRADIEG